MIGTIYERLSAVQKALVDLGVDREAISVRGHPEAIRPFALGFAGDKAKSLREIEFVDQLIKWRGGYVWQDTLQPKDRVFLAIDRIAAIVVPLDALPCVDTCCSEARRAVVLQALERVTGIRGNDVAKEAHNE